MITRLTCRGNLLLAAAVRGANDTVHMAVKFSPSLDTLVPELREIVLREDIDPSRLNFGLPVEKDSRVIQMRDRHLIMFSDGTRGGAWKVPSLRALFRGDKLPPDLTRYPPEYVPHFFAIERDVMNLFELDSRRSDQEMEEVYATLRRRPDGRSLGTTHDWVWSFAAFFLGRFVVSQAEFEAIFQQLSVSTRRFAMQPQSYNYADYIRTLSLDE